MSAYVKSFDDKTKWMYFSIEYGELLKKCNKIWNEVSNNIKKGFDNESIYNKNNKKYLRNKMKSYKGEIKANFNNNKIPKQGFYYICLLMILIDSALKKNGNCYPQVLLEECDYIVTETIIKDILKIVC